MSTLVRWNVSGNNSNAGNGGSCGATKNRQQHRNTEMEAKPERKKDTNDLCRAISPIYYLGKVCGLVPVRFLANTTGGYRARLSIFDLLYSLAVLTLLLGAEIWGLWRDLKDGWEYSTRLKSRTAIIATCSDVLGIMGLTAVCIVGSPFRWKHLQLVINKLIEVDKKIRIMPSDKRSARRFTIGLTVCTLIYLWFNSILDFYTWSRKTKVHHTMPDKGPINYAPLYFMYTIIISTEIQYSVSTYNIGRRFVRLNDSLTTLFDTDNVTDYFKKSAEIADDVPEKTSPDGSRRQLELTSYRVFRKLHESQSYVNGISEIRWVHSSLCDTISLINNTFGAVILTVTVTCLLHLIITPYFLIVQAGEKHEWIFLLVQGGWCIFHVTRMLIIVQPSYSTIAEGKKTAILVTCGLFPLDRTLITSIAGVVTTYLVILIQFQNADDTKGDADIIRNVSQIFKHATPLQNLTGIKVIV